MRKGFLLLACVCVVACHGTHKKVVASHAKVSRQQNSYASFLFYRLNNAAQNDKEAAKNLAQALKMAPDSAFLWNQKAYFDLQQSDVVSAEADVRTALEKNPNDVAALLLLGKIAAAKNDIPSALDYYSKVLSIDPKNEEAYNLVARDSLSAKDKAGAKKALNTCMYELPDAISCTYYLATIKQESGDDDGALTLYESLLDLNPDQTGILNTVGEIYLKKSQYEKALEVFRQLSQQMPDDLIVRLRVALLYYQLKDADSAIREFREIHDHFPNSDKVNYFLGLLYFEKSDFDNAYSFFDQVQYDSGVFKDAINRQILILKQRNADPNQALQLVESKFKEKNAAYYQMRAALLMLRTDYLQARTTLEAGLKKFPADERMLFQRAVAYDKTNSWDKARQDLNQLIQINPKSADAYNYLGYSLADRGLELEQALAYVEKALELNPDEGHIVDSLGWVHFKMGNNAKALLLLQKAIHMEPTEPTILEHLGDVYAAIRNSAKARECYEKSLKILADVSQNNADANAQRSGIEKKMNGL